MMEVFSPDNWAGLMWYWLALPALICFGLVFVLPLALILLTVLGIVGMFLVLVAVGIYSHIQFWFDDLFRKEPSNDQ